MSDRYQGNYSAMPPHAPNYGDIRSPPTTYPTGYIPPHPGQPSNSYPPIPDPRYRPSHRPTMHQMSYSTAERGTHAQVEAHGPYARGSITNTKLTEEPTPVMANEELTKNVRNAAQLTALNDSCARMSLSSTEEHAKTVRLVYTPVRVKVILIPLVGFRMDGSQFQVLARFLH
jgi:homeobox protein YOX1/YHP1